MLSVHCPGHGRDVLIVTSRIERIDPSAAGHVVRWRCTCGTVGRTEVPRRPELALAG